MLEIPGGYVLASAFPIDRVLHFTGVGGGLLAVSVGVFAFVPLIIEIALQRSVDPDKAVRQARRADSAFDLVLVSVVLFGVSLCMGLLATYVHFYPLYVSEVALLAAGVVALLVGTVQVGVTLRNVRRGS